MSEAKTNRVDPIQGEIIHVYDGIEEADNALPLWWLLTLYGAIAFSVVYWIIYHELETAPLPREAYAAALAANAGGGDVSEELLVAMVDDPGAVARGRGHFEQYCVVCHASQGEGNIGPNLTDAYWLHGGGPTDIHATIHDGVLQAGMPAWGASLGGEATVELSAYVMTLRGTNVDGKEPQGELWVPGAPVADPGSPAEVDDEAQAPTDSDLDAVQEALVAPGEGEPAPPDGDAVEVDVAPPGTDDAPSDTPAMGEN